jgi:uncharacterized protein
MITISDIQKLIQETKNDELINVLEGQPALADGKTDQGISILQFAAYCRNKFAIDSLRQLKKKFDIFESASIGDFENVKYQLEKENELLNTFSPDGFTSLGLACFFGHSSIVKWLIEKGADVNIASNNQLKVAPIHSACAISDYDTVEILIKAGADVNARQIQGITPLHEAAHNGQTRLAALLIKHGADTNAKMDNGHTPSYMAKEKGFNETANLIEEFEKL